MLELPRQEAGTREHRTRTFTGPWRPPDLDTLRRKSSGKPHVNPGSFSEAGSPEVKCCYQTLDSAAVTVHKNGNRARDKLTEPKPKRLRARCNGRSGSRQSRRAGSPGSLVVHQVPGKRPCCHGAPVSLRQCLPEASLCKRFG